MPIKPPEDNSLLHKGKLLLNKIGTIKNTKENWVCRWRRQPLHSGGEVEIRMAILVNGMKTSQKSWKQRCYVIKLYYFRIYIQREKKSMLKCWRDVWALFIIDERWSNCLCGNDEQSEKCDAHTLVNSIWP